MLPSPSPRRQQEARHHERDRDSPKRVNETEVRSRAATVVGLRPTLSETAAQAKADAHCRSEMRLRLTSTQNAVPSGEGSMVWIMAGYWD